jgi:hypothetical protein
MWFGKSVREIIYVSAKDCVTFLYQDGKFDFLPAER